MVCVVLAWFVSVSPHCLYPHHLYIRIDWYLQKIILMCLTLMILCDSGVYDACIYIFFSLALTHLAIECIHGARKVL